MNSKDRKRLQRLYSLLTSVPAPAGIGPGSQSAAVSGFISYGRDMALVQERTSSLLLNMYWPSPDSTPEENEAEIEACLDSLEAFVRRRKAEGWALKGAGSES